MMQLSSHNRRPRVQEVLIDMNSAPGINKFFEGSYRADSRVQQVLDRAECDFVHERRRVEEI